MCKCSENVGVSLRLGMVGADLQVSSCSSHLEISARLGVARARSNLIRTSSE